MIQKQVLAACALGLLTAAPLAAQPRLAVAGDPTFDGLVTLSVLDDESIGDLVWLALGLDPLPLTQPVPLAKGGYFIDTLLLAMPLVDIPASGQLDVPLTLPSHVPGAEGLHIVLQTQVGGALSNPASIPLDLPYYETADALVLSAPQPQQASNFGDGCAVGDFDGDGQADIAVSAWDEEWLGDEKAGRVYVFWGPDHEQSTAFVSPVSGPWRHFGAGLCAGDVNADSIDDLLVSESSAHPTLLGEPGLVHVFLGTAGGLPALPDTSLTSAEVGDAGSLYGRGSLVVGDWNGDGHVDIAAAAPNADEGGLADAGRLEVFWGPDFVERQLVASPDPGTQDYFGSRLISADLTGDGIPDLIESSGRDDNNGVVNLGRAHVFSGPTLAPFATLDEPLPAGLNTRFGNATAVADFDDDGHADLAVSDQNGRVHVFWGPTLTEVAVLEAPPALPAGAPSGGVSFGYFMAAGDANADGHDDLVVTEPFHGGTGAVHLFLGPHLSVSRTLLDVAPQVFDDFGWGVRLVDLGGDGAPELLIGNRSADVGAASGAGTLTVFDG